MKKVLFLIIGIILTIPIEIKATDRAFDYSRFDDCVNQGTCMLLCGYTHKIRETVASVDPPKYTYRSAYIYYHFDGNWQVSWFSQETEDYLALHTKKWNTISEYKDNVFFQFGSNTDLTEKGICPSNGYVDYDTFGWSSEVCFDKDGNYCTEKDPGGFGTDFKGQSSESILEYNYMNHINTYFKDYAFAEIDTMTCDKILDNKVAKDAIAIENVNFDNFLHGNEMPAFIKNNDEFKNQLESAKSNYEERVNICEEQSRNKIDEYWQQGKINEAEAIKEKEQISVAANQVRETISTVREVITNSDSPIGVNFNFTNLGVCNIITPELQKWLIQLLDVVKIVALALTLVLGMFDFLKAATSGEADAMKKTWQRFYKRLITVVILFLLPVIIEFILGLITINGVDSGNPLCGIR